MNFKRIANRHIQRSEDEILQSVSVYHTDLDTSKMLRALSRSASIKSGRNKTPSDSSASSSPPVPPTLDPNFPTEPAQPCVFTDSEIRTTGTKETAGVQSDMTTAAPNLNPTGSKGSSSLRRLVPNPASDHNNNDDDGNPDRTDNNNSYKNRGGETVPPGSNPETNSEKPEEQPRRKSSWYSWVWSDEKRDTTTSTTTIEVESSEESGNDESAKLRSGTNTPDSDNDKGSGKKTNTTTNDTNENKSWAFWSKNGTSTTGEIAISGTDTQDHPKNIKKPIIGDEQQQQQTAKKRRVVIRPNIVGPSPTDCFALSTQTHRIKSSLTKLGEYFVPKSHQIQEFDPVLRCGPQKIRKAVVIGVHGFFPAKVVRSILGEPTGTSIKFANEAAMAVQRWAEEKGYQVDIEKIALEGEGKVLDRVENLYQLLMNWIDLIHRADFVYFAAHSQGTPVAVHLLSRLVEEGHVEHTKQLALLGMAGISLGPMSGLDSKLVMRAYSSIESTSLSELFQFQRLDSLQSRKYIDSLRTIIQHGTKVAFIGSMNDQLVPMYSSTCIHVSHPNIYRAVYVDGQDVVAPEFVSTLISLALRLRNIGSSDHGVIKEISSALSGPLTGGGHSKIYNEPQVYDLMVRHALETSTSSSYKNLPVKVDSSFKVPSSVNTNPYLLPWCMRGLMSEATSRSEFMTQINELIDEFESWKPDSKPLKDVKYRLSAIKHVHVHRPKL